MSQVFVKKGEKIFTIYDHLLLIDYCKSVGIKFLSTAFDLSSVDFLKSLNLDVWKVPSGEITNYPYLKKIGSYNEKVIMSTGMASLGEIESAIEVLVESGTERKKITILQCNSSYPTPYEDVNLNTMATIKAAFGLDIGYSDHSLGVAAAIAAAAMGATVIEKHFTKSNKLEGPDHLASLEPEELKSMVSGIRSVEKSLGSFIKHPSKSEKENMTDARRSIHYAIGLKVGDVIKEEDLIALRPGSGISPMEWDSIIGKRLSSDVGMYTMVRMDDMLPTE